MARVALLRGRQSTAFQEPLISGDEVARVAYELFERRGRTHGHDLEDWLEAERIVRQRRRGGNGR